METCVSNGRNVSVRIPNRTKKAIQVGFEVPDNCIEITYDEIEYITGGVYGDHWDYIMRCSGVDGMVTMCGMAGLTAAAFTTTAYYGLLIGGTLGLTPIGWAAGIVFCIAGAITGNLAQSMVNATTVAFDNYYSKGKSWSLWEHWGWFGLVLDGYEVRD